MTGLGRRKILVVEDHPGLARALSFALKAHRYEPLGPARTLREGIALAPDADAVLLDVCLPDTRGAEGAAAMRAAHPELPLVVHTAEASGELRSALAALGVPWLLKGELEPLFELLERPGFFECKEGLPALAAEPG